MNTKTDHEKIELPIARRLVRKALEMGYSVTVYDGEDFALKKATKLEEIMKALASTDCDILHFYNADNKKQGWMLLIWGNLDDVISDYSNNDKMDKLFHAVV